MENGLEAKVAGIVADCLDQHGLDSYAAARRILDIPEIAEALELRDDLKAVAKQISERITNT